MTKFFLSTSLNESTSSNHLFDHHHKAARISNRDDFFLQR